MTATYIALNRGQSGFTPSEFVTGSTSDAGADMEIRINAQDANSKNITREDAVNFAKSVQRFLELGTNVGGITWPTV